MRWEAVLSHAKREGAKKKGNLNHEKHEIHKAPCSIDERMARVALLIALRAEQTVQFRAERFVYFVLFVVQSLLRGFA